MNGECIHAVIYQVNYTCETLSFPSILLLILFLALGYVIMFSDTRFLVSAVFFLFDNHFFPLCLRFCIIYLWSRHLLFILQSVSSQQSPVLLFWILDLPFSFSFKLWAFLLCFIWGGHAHAVSFSLFFFFNHIFFSVPYYSRFHHTTLIHTNVLERVFPL